MTRVQLRKLGVHIYLLAIVGTLGMPAARAMDPELPKTPQVLELAPGVFQYVNANGLWNSGFVIGTRSVAVIDAMLTPADARKVLAEIRSRTDLPVSHLVITHQHSDHYFGAQVFSPPADLIAHEAVNDRYANHLEEEFKFRSAISPGTDLSEVKVVLPTLTVGDVEGKVMTLHLGNKDIELYFFGRGQTPDALFAYLPAEKLLFTGDVFNRKSINLMASAPTLDGWFSILDRLQSMPARLYLGGHGLPANKDDFRAYRTMLRTFIDRVKEAIAKNQSVDEAVATITLPQYRDWRNYESFTAANVRGLYARFRSEAPK